ncbi:MAG TPA: VOC family protein [Actinomycetota bacterium]|nr:VOC family protein [Actinomycetota bacterium]
MPSCNGMSHIALTVSDIDRSVQWYESVFGGTRFMEMKEEDFSLAMLMTPGGVLLSLHAYPNSPDGDRFSEFRIGLDHLSFCCETRADVVEWAERLEELGVEHSPVADAPYGHVLVFRDPDNIQLEFMAPLSGA